VSPPPCREERYVEIRDEMRHMLARVGWKPDFVEKSVPILPISGWMGDNLIKQSTNMAWWKGMEVVSLDNRKVQVNCLLDVSTCGCWGGGAGGVLYTYPTQRDDTVGRRPCCG
jgi:hypothetical protein